MEKPIIIVDKRLGSGAENICYRVQEIHPRHGQGYRHMRRPTEHRKVRHVVKVPGPQSIWQVNTAEFRDKCIQALRQAEIDHIPTTVLRRPTIVLQKDGEEKDELFQPEIALMSPLVEDFGDLTLKYHHLFDPAIQEQLISLAREAERIVREDGIGIDPYGGEIVMDFVEGMREEIFRILERLAEGRTPEYVRELIRSRITGVQGQMRNILVGRSNMTLTGDDASYYEEYGGEGPIKILEPGKICLTDIGMHDLTNISFSDTTQGRGIRKVLNLLKKEPAKSITVPMQYMMWGTLIELLIQANPELAKRDDLPFTKEPRLDHQIKRDLYRLASRGVVKFMSPKFERREARNRQTQERSTQSS